MEATRHVDTLRFPYSLSFRAATRAVGISAAHMQTLQISRKEAKRYFQKSTFVSLGFVGFAQDKSLGQAIGAGTSGALACIYDVVTDWGHDLEPLSTFESIAEQTTPPPLVRLVTDMMEKDLAGTLEQDGLERGVTSLIFVLEMMGIRQKVAGLTNIDILGLRLQMCDDILDYEEDVRDNEQNCLNNIKLRNQYLQDFIAGLRDSEINRMFPYAQLLATSIRIGRKKAFDMLLNPAKYFSV